MSKMGCCDYDKLALNYDDVRTPSKEYLMYWTSHLADFGNLKDNDVVLDIGCGTGNYTEAFASSGTRRVFGLDRSRQMLSRAHTKYPGDNITWIQARCQELPFTAGSFDVAYMMLVAHHIPDEERLKVCREVNKILRKGGRLIIMTRSPEHIRDSLIGLFPGVCEIDTARMPEPKVLQDILKTAGFRTVEIEELPNYKLYRNRTIFLKKVEQKFISTLTMFPEDDFQKRFEVFKERLEERFGDVSELYDPLIFTFVIAEK